MRFGEHLIKAKAVSNPALEEALSVQRFQQRKVGRILLELGYLSERELDHQLTLFLKPEKVESVSSLLAEAKALSLPEAFAKWTIENGVVAVREDSGCTTLVSTRFSDSLISDVESYGRQCKILLTSYDSLQWLRASLSEKEDDRPQVLAEEEDSDDSRLSLRDPFTSLFRDMIIAARQMQASDIHIQPEQGGLDLRFRVFGDLHTWKSLDREYRQSFVNEAKRLSNLSIAISGEPQDSRLFLKKENLRIRVNLVPTQWGEKIVMRILDLNKKFDLTGSGLSEGALSELRRSITAKNGVVIVSGETGSGKTTTLYSLLNELDREKKNVITIENPIEYSFGGISQIEVSRKMSFSDALRAVLRQDPDVILLGEIRDRETADLCAQAASTGHLVLTTLHANSSIDVIGRLMRLGVEPFVLESCMRLSSAQRLIKKLCPDCSSHPTNAEMRTLKEFLKERKLSAQEGADFRIRNPKGCDKCVFGTIGRIPVLEYVTEDAIGRYLQKSKTVTPVVSLTEAALRVAETGKSDISEVMHVA